MINGILPYQIHGVHFRCEMRYDENNPYEMTFVFRQACQEADCKDMHEYAWVVSRELITEGVESETWVGVGDVSLRRDSHNTIQVIFRAHEANENTSTVTVPRKPLKEFLRLSYDLVDAGKESEQINWAEFDDERALWSL